MSNWLIENALPEALLENSKISFVLLITLFITITIFSLSFSLWVFMKEKEDAAVIFIIMPIVVSVIFGPAVGLFLDETFVESYKKDQMEEFTASHGDMLTVPTGDAYEENSGIVVAPVDFRYGTHRFHMPSENLDEKFVELFSLDGIGEVLPDNRELLVHSYTEKTVESNAESLGLNEADVLNSRFSEEAEYSDYYNSDSCEYVYKIKNVGEIVTAFGDIDSGDNKDGIDDRKLDVILENTERESC